MRLDPQEIGKRKLIGLFDQLLADNEQLDYAGAAYESEMQRLRAGLLYGDTAECARQIQEKVRDWYRITRIDELYDEADTLVLSEVAERFGAMMSSIQHEVYAILLQQDAPKEPVDVRPMIVDDMPEVLLATSEFDPYDERRFISQLRMKSSEGRIAAVQNFVVGSMALTFSDGRIDVHEFLVHPLWRRSGIGTTMLSRLKEEATASNRTRIHMMVHELNRSVLRFLTKNDFDGVGTVRQPYTFSVDDGFMLRYGS